MGVGYVHMLLDDSRAIHSFETSVPLSVKLPLYETRLPTVPRAPSPPHSCNLSLDLQCCRAR